MLSTVRKNKPELLSELLVTKNRKVTSSMFAFTDKSHCCLLLSQERDKGPADEHHAQICCPEHQRRQKDANGFGPQRNKVRS